MYKGQYLQDKYCFEHFLLEKKNGVFLDIGASDGIRFSNTYFFEKERGFTGLCIEPRKKEFDLLKENRSCSICENVAVDTTEANEIDFLELKGYGGGLSGLMKYYDPRHVQRINNTLFHPKNKGSSVLKVKTVRLETLLDKYNLRNIDLCSLDIEGGELEILKSIDWNKTYIHILIVENNYNNPNLRQYLESVGFEYQTTIANQDEIYKKSKFSDSSFSVVSSLINGLRFDLAAKLIYVKYKIKNLNTSFHIDLYTNHILTFNGGWEWPGGLKHSVDDFISCFDDLIENFDINKVGVIPISEDGIICDGSHRISVAYVKNFYYIQTKITEKERRPYDYQFFLYRNMYGIPDITPEKNKKAILSEMKLPYADEMALEFCRQCVQLKIIVIFPRAIGKETEVSNILASYGNVIYGILMDVSFLALDNLIKELYRGERWAEENSLSKTKQCWDIHNPKVKVYVYDPKNSDCSKIKTAIRNLYAIGNHSVHINDTFEESKRIAGCLFNSNSRCFLHLSKTSTKHLTILNQKILETYKEKLKDKDSDNYCIVGSFVLTLYGLREAADLDYIFSSDAYELYGIDSHNKYYNYYNLPLDDIIYNPKNHAYVAGLKIACPEVVLSMKMNRKEPKDLEDIELFNKMLNPLYKFLFETKYEKKERNRYCIYKHNNFDIYQITFYKIGLRLKNFYTNNCFTGNIINFFPAIDTTTNVEKSIEEALKTNTYDMKIPRCRKMIKKCPGKIGCNLSHYYLYCYILEHSPCSWHLILEDDVDMNGDFPFSEFEELLKILENSAISTHYIKLITFKEFVDRQFMPEFKILENLYKKIEDWGTGAQFISTEGLRILLKHRAWDFIDHVVNSLQNQLNCVCYKNNFFQHHGIESGIQFNEKEHYYGSLIYNHPTRMSSQSQYIGFPEMLPNVSYYLYGWTIPPNIKEIFRRTFKEYNVKILIDLGSWYGLSTTSFLKDCEVDKIYCVDLWDEDYIAKNPCIGFYDYSIFADHPLYQTFIRNMWNMKDRVIPIKTNTITGLKVIKHLPFIPDAVYIDAEYSYNAVSEELKTIIECFGNILICGSHYNTTSYKGVVNAVNDFLKKSTAYRLSVIDNYFILKTKPIRVKYSGFWSNFDSNRCFLNRLQLISFVKKDYDFIYHSDYTQFQPELNKPIIFYSTEAWYTPRPEYNFAITYLPTEGNNYQLRNYERIYFERYGANDVYSNIPKYNLDKDKFCCFVVKNPNAWQRNLFFNMLNSKRKVDSLGSHFHNVGFEILERDMYNDDEYLQIIGKYKFCICFENTSKKNYLTEKLYNAMKSGTIPIYWGDSNCTQIFNPLSFIYISTRNTEKEQIKQFEKAIEEIIYLDCNPYAYLKMLGQKRIINVGKENYRVGYVLDEIKTKIKEIS